MIFVLSVKLKHCHQQIKLKAFSLRIMSKFNAKNKYNRDKSKYFSSTFNLKRFPGNHLPIAYLQLTLKVNEATFTLVYAYVDC